MIQKLNPVDYFVKCFYLNEPFVPVDQMSAVMQNSLFDLFNILESNFVEHLVF